MSDTDIREWALANGKKVSARGPIGAEVRAEYAAEHMEPTDADFPDDVATAGPPPPDRDPDSVEKRPRSIATPRKASLPWNRGGGKAKPGGRPAKRKPRVALDDTIATVWRALAGLAKPLPATSRLLKLQAPCAGIILEPVIKDTVIDRVLQPLARTSKGAEAVTVLLGPPALVTAMQLNPQIIPFAMPALRELMLRMVKIAGPSMTAALQEERAFESEFGGTVDDLIAMLFAGVFEEGAEPMSAEQEEAAIRKAQEAMEATAA